VNILAKKVLFVISDAYSEAIREVVTDNYDFDVMAFGNFGSASKHVSKVGGNELLGVLIAMSKECTKNDIYSLSGFLSYLCTRHSGVKVIAYSDSSDVLKDIKAGLAHEEDLGDVGIVEPVETFREAWIKSTLIGGFLISKDIYPNEDRKASEVARRVGRGNKAKTETFEGDGDGLAFMSSLVSMTQDLERITKSSNVKDIVEKILNGDAGKADVLGDEIASEHRERIAELEQNISRLTDEGGDEGKIYRLKSAIQVLKTDLRVKNSHAIVGVLSEYVEEIRRDFETSSSKVKADLEDLQQESLNMDELDKDVDELLRIKEEREGTLQAVCNNAVNGVSAVSAALAQVRTSMIEDTNSLVKMVKTRPEDLGEDLVENIHKVYTLSKANNNTILANRDTLLRLTDGFKTTLRNIMAISDEIKIVSDLAIDKLRNGLNEVRRTSRISYTVSEGFQTNVLPVFGIDGCGKTAYALGVAHNKISDKPTRRALVVDLDSVSPELQSYGEVRSIFGVYESGINSLVEMAELPGVSMIGFTDGTDGEMLIAGVDALMVKVGIWKMLKQASQYFDWISVIFGTGDTSVELDALAEVAMAAVVTNTNMSNYRKAAVIIKSMLSCENIRQKIVVISGIHTEQMSVIKQDYRYLGINNTVRAILLPCHPIDVYKSARKDMFAVRTTMAAQYKM
jgi:hypothetical protein